jgi:hypothetical protein
MHSLQKHFNSHTEADFTLSSVKSSKAPVLLLPSTLQLALDLLDFCDIACREGDLAGDDYEQHVDERVSWNIQQLAEHYAPSWSELKIAIS